MECPALTLYAIHRSKTGAPPEAVAESFSWFAAVLLPIHALVHGLWGQLAIIVLALIVIIVGAAYLGSGASLGLYLLLAISCGLAAPGARIRALMRRGHAPIGYRVATDPDLARLAALEARP